MVTRLTIGPLTPEAFAPFGEVIEMAGAASERINYGRTEKWANLASVDTDSGNGRTAVHRYRSQPIELPFSIEVMERHPLGSQAFIPLHPRPFLVVVAVQGREPDGSGICGFITNGEQGVNFYKGTWHHYQLTLFEPGDYLVIDRSGPGMNLDEVRLREAVVIESLPFQRTWNRNSRPA